MRKVENPFCKGFFLSLGATPHQLNTWEWAGIKPSTAEVTGIMERVDSSSELQPSWRCAPDGRVSRSEQGPSMLKFAVFLFTSHNVALLKHLVVKSNTLSTFRELSRNHPHPFPEPIIPNRNYTHQAIPIHIPNPPPRRLAPQALEPQFHFLPQ